MTFFFFNFNLQHKNPFRSESDIKSIFSGVVSNGSNADNAEEVGNKVIQNMVEKKVKDFTFKKKIWSYR